jgi:hypothetical protein
MPAISIPKGQKCTISRVGNNGPTVTALLEEDVQLNLSSSFSPLVESDAGMAEKLLGVLGNLVGFSTKWKQFSYQTWTGTEPLSATVSVAFRMRANAKADVWDKVVTLLQFSLPSEGTGGNLIPPGPTIVEAFSGNTNSGKRYTVNLGGLNFPNVLITRCEPSFSKTRTKSGYPIYAKVSVTFQTVTSATTQMITSMGGF